MALRPFTLATVLALLLGGCSGLWGDDEVARYAQRTDRITMSAGDAKEVNAVTHMLTPWPPGVGDRWIVTDGTRMQRAIERYHRGARPPDPMPDIGLEGTTFGTALPSEAPVLQGAGGAGRAPAVAAPGDLGGGAPPPGAPAYLGGGAPPPGAPAYLGGGAPAPGAPAGPLMPIQGQ
jgi:hypothetical protein